MTTTYNLLLQRWMATSLSLTEVREHYFPNLKTNKSLSALINKGEIQLHTFRSYKSRRAPRRVHLADLATFLDSQAKTAA